MYALDHSLVPDLTAGTVIYFLENDLIDGMSRFPETTERAKSAVRFLSGEHGSYGTEHEKARSHEAYLRAALAEFVSMEETLPRDLARANIIGAPIRLTNSPNPLLHIVRELRHLEIHQRTSLMSHFSIKALWGEARKPIDFQVWYIDPITVPAFKRLRNAKYYSDADIADMLNWFEDAQKQWGISEIVLRAIKEFCKLIIKQYE